jgi:hypothetical protein
LIYLKNLSGEDLSKVLRVLVSPKPGMSRSACSVALKVIFQVKYDDDQKRGLRNIYWNVLSNLYREKEEIQMYFIALRVPDLEDIPIKESELQKWGLLKTQLTDFSDPVQFCLIQTQLAMKDQYGILNQLIGRYLSYLTPALQMYVLKLHSELITDKLGAMYEALYRGLDLCDVDTQVYLIKKLIPRDPGALEQFISSGPVRGWTLANLSESAQMEILQSTDANTPPILLAEILRRLTKSPHKKVRVASIQGKFNQLSRFIPVNPSS